MLRKTILGALAALATMLCTSGFANPQGTAAEAKAMLEIGSAFEALRAFGHAGDVPGMAQFAE